MKTAEQTAIEFLMGQITLSKISGDSEHLGVTAYNESLENCDLFMFDLHHTITVDGGQYVAVPRDGRAPFYVGS